MPHHYTVLHLRGMCKAELQEYEDAIADLTGRAHYCNALFSRGMCHMNLGNHEKAFDDILRADVLDSRSGESFYRVMKRFAATDPGNPGVQKAAELCAALEKRKMKCLKVLLSLYALSLLSFVRHNVCNETQQPSGLALCAVFVLFWCQRCTHLFGVCTELHAHILTIVIGTS